MADKTIGSLKRATRLDDESLLIAEQQGEAVALEGALFKEFVKDAADQQVGAAQASATAAAKYAGEAASSAQDASNALTQIGTSVSDAAASATAAEDARQAIENMLVEAVTLANGNPATVTKNLVNGVVKLVFGLPAGEKGERGDPGSSIQSIARTAGTGASGTTDTYTITLTDGSTTEFFVYNGKDGTGAGDMTSTVYDPQGKATDIFRYVDDALSNVDPDVTADEVKFTDGENLQQKYDNGDLSGEDGITPHIGENGNWFIGTTDTEVQAAGQSATTIQTVTLAAADWSNLSQTVSCLGILADETKQVITVFPSMASRDTYMDSGITCTGVGANMLIFTADAIPSADLIVYVAIEEAGHAPLEVYSTEETVVGTWIDGKPIYRCTYVGAATGSVVNLADLSVLPIDTFIKVEGYIASSTSALPGGYATGTTSTYGEKFINIWVGDSLLRCYSPGYASGTIYASVYYTKTTDTATISIPTAAALMAAYEEGVDEA